MNISIQPELLMFLSGVVLAFVGLCVPTFPLGIILVEVGAIFLFVAPLAALAEVFSQKKEEL